MADERRRRVEELFQAAADLAPRERDAFLTARCADEAGREDGIRAEVESLLAQFDAGTLDLLRSPAPLPVALGGGVGVGEAPGDRVGRYTLVEALGEGGFGIVYLAEQTEPVRRRVALKIIKLGMDTRRVVARFEAERQALAMMDHPHVARVFDAGATEQGRPYFVMELVPGQPITTFCDGARLGVDARLRLFAQVCDAVQHAHQKGIIHRDLKPSNVLVEATDGHPRAKVIDFGIAKAVRGGELLGTPTLMTEQGQLIGTPAYMSPEQAAGAPDAIDTRTDIYSLGVLLYELLTGATPLDARTAASAGLAELQRTIREQDPAKPSARLTTLGRTASEVARNRGTEERALRGRLRGDLDWIVMRAIEKDRTRRYATASEFAADIARHLGHEPVLAGPPSRAYRVRKFVRRNRAGVVGAAVVGLTLVAGVVASTTMYLRAEEALRGEADQHRRAELARREAESRRTEAETARTEADIARQKAEDAAATATTIRDFLVNDMLMSMRPEEALGRTITVEEVLGNAARKVAEAFPDRPATEAAVRNTLGGTYRRLGNLPEAEAHLRRALELRRASHPAGDPEIARSANNLAIVLRQLGRPDEAKALYRESLAIFRAHSGPRSADAAATMTNLVTLMNDARELDEAEALARESVAIHRTLFGDADIRTAMTLDRLGLMLDARGRYDEAEAPLREALAVMLALHGPGHPATATVQTNLGGVLWHARKLDEAEALLRSAADAFRALGGGGGGSQNAGLATTLASLARLLGEKEGEGGGAGGDLDEAEAAAREALAIHESVLPADHPWLLNARSILGSILTKRGQFKEAESILLRAHEHVAAHPRPNPVLIAEIRAHLATLYESWGTPAEALAPEHTTASEK